MPALVGLHVLVASTTRTPLLSETLLRYHCAMSALAMRIAEKAMSSMSSRALRRCRWRRRKRRKRKWKRGHVRAAAEEPPDELRAVVARKRRRSGPVVAWQEALRDLRLV